MTIEQENTLLFEDMLDQVVGDPSLVHRWHRLVPLHAAASAAQQAQACQFLSAQVPTEGITGFLRATFLASVTGDISFLAPAATALRQISPLDPDRVAAYLILAWARLLSHVPQRARFITALEECQFPALLQQVGQHLASRVVVRPPTRSIDRVGKVALVVPHMSGVSHAPTGLALAQANLLLKNGIQIELFSAQELSVASMPDLLGGGDTTLLLPPDTEGWAGRLDGALTMHLADDRLSLMRRWAAILGGIARFDPDLVLFVGLYSPLLAPLYQCRPVLGLSVHSFAPIAPVDAWLCADPAQAGPDSTSWAPQVPASLAIHHPYRVRVAAITTPASRCALGLTDDALVIISVGYRLQDEINGDWAQRMRIVLGQRPDVVWLLVGGSDQVPACLAGLPAGQVRSLPHQKDVPAILALCDVYINPPRMGGGFSVAEAMAASLPVVAFANSDGGNKIGAAAQHDGDGYFARLAALLTDAELRAKEGAAMQALFAATLDLAHSGPGLLAACDATLAHFQQRVKCSVTQPFS